MKPSREQRKQAAIENASYPEYLIQIPAERWMAACWDEGRIEVWRSRHFLVQVFAERNGAERLTISHVALNRSGGWQEGITWDDLQRLKYECGRGEKWAVEIFPSEFHVVNVANMRHLWVLNEAPAFAWIRSEKTIRSQAPNTEEMGPAFSPEKEAELLARAGERKA